MKPYTLDEVEIENNGIYPFRKAKAPIENTYVNVLPHSMPQNYMTHGGYGMPYGPMPQTVPNWLAQSQAYPPTYFKTELKKSHLNTLQKQQQCLKMDAHLQRLE